MNTREQLNQYLRGLESRLRVLAWSRGAAIAFGVALGSTIGLVLITNAYAFSETSMIVARVVLYVSLAVALGLGLIIPLLKLNEHRAAGKAEHAHPAFEQRLLTYLERRDQSDPMLDLLAEDTLKPAQQAAPTTIIPQKSVFAFATGAGFAGAVLLWLILLAPGYLGFGARTLWAGAPKAGSGSFYQIKVEPGDETVRRRTDVSIVASLHGFQAPQVRLMAKYDSAAKWEEMVMAPRPGEASYGFMLAAVPEGLQYYVEAAGVKSNTYKVNVVDLPGIKNIKVTYHYPQWMHAKDYVEDPGGDLRAVVGTMAELTVETDKPLVEGVIVMQDGTQIDLHTVNGNIVSGNVPIQKQGAYHFAAKVNNEMVRLTPDYFIEAQEDQGPKVSIRHPGGDAQVNPLEEVIVQVEATDDFGVTQIKLHYSVNGEPEKVVDLAASGGPQANGKVTLYLEDFKMIPGDVISMYATAKDARTEASSDIAFVQAMPFEKNYTQSQQAGGGGGGGGGQEEQNEISRRQREIISATHKSVRGTATDRAAANKDRADFLSETQATLKKQAESLAQRIQARELDGESTGIKEFVKEIQAAAEEMGPAADLLRSASWEKALEPENKALQHLQRAEQLQRDIQVAFGNQGGGGGGGGGNAGRDLANLFDLELDTQKNQYEQAQSAKGGGGAEEQQKQVDEAMKKLEELARRQQQLADQSKNQQNKQQSVDRRWDQENLRREAEELRKQIEQMQQQLQAQQQQNRSQSQLSRNGQQSQGQGQGQSQGSQGQQSAQSQQQSQAQQRQMQQLADRIKQAEQDMRDVQSAANKGNQSEADAAARRAAERLQEGAKQAGQMQRQTQAGSLDQVQRNAQALAERQRQAENQLKQMAQNGITPQQRAQMLAEREQRSKDYQALERDINRQAQQVRQQSPDASRALRDGLATAQDQLLRDRLTAGMDWIRQGQQSDLNRWLQQETPLTKGLDELSQSVRDAQNKLGAAGDGKQQGAGSEQERQLAGIENARATLERLQEQLRQAQQQGQGNQGQGKDGQQQGQGQQQAQGQQQGQGQQGQGKEGQGKGQGQGQGQGQQQGNQQGGGQQGGGNQAGGNQANGDGFGGGSYAGGYNGGYDRFGRYNPQGIYDRAGTAPVDPRQVVRDVQRDLNAIRNSYRDNPDLVRQAAALEREIQNLAVGNPSGPELEARLSRTILPQLESLEVQIRHELDEAKGGHVRSPATDRVPAGFAPDWQEYTRRLSKTK